MRILRLSFILVCILATGFGNAATQQKQSPQDDDAVQRMEELASAGIEQALKAISTSGGFYPFALVSMDDGEVKMMGYEGDPEKAPDPDAFSTNLYRELRKLILNNPGIEAAAIYRLHHAEKNQGDEPVPGVWALVDHRDQPAMIVFQPLVRNEEGQYTLGELMYQAAPDPLFPPKGKQPPKKPKASAD